MKRAGDVVPWDHESLQIVYDFQYGYCSIRTRREDIKYVPMAISYVPDFVVSALLQVRGLNETAHRNLFRQLEEDGLWESSDVGDIGDPKLLKLREGQLLRVDWQCRDREWEAEVFYAAGENEPFIPVPFFFPLIFPREGPFARCKTYTLTRAGLAALDAASQPRVAETSTAKPETRPRESDSQCTTEPTRSPRLELPEPPPSKCREAWELAQSTDMSQEEIAAEINKRYFTTHGQGHICRLIARYERYLKQTGLLDRMPRSAKRAKRARAIDPGVLEMGPRQDGLTPRQRDGGIDDSW